MQTHSGWWILPMAAGSVALVATSATTFGVLKTFGAMGLMMIASTAFAAWLSRTAQLDGDDTATPGMMAGTMMAGAKKNALGVNSAGTGAGFGTFPR